MTWLDPGLLSAIHVKIALTLLGIIVLYGATFASNHVPQRAFARAREVNRPSAERSGVLP